VSQFGHQGLDLLLCRFCPGDAPQGLRSLEFFVQLSQAMPVVSLGLFVQPLSGVTEIAYMQVRFANVPFERYSGFCVSSR